MPSAINDVSGGTFDGSVYINEAVRVACLSTDVDDISEAFIDDGFYVSDIVRNCVQPSDSDDIIEARFDDGLCLRVVVSPPIHYTTSTETYGGEQRSLIAQII